MIEVKRLGHATFKTPDMQRAVDYWTHVIGLSVVERNKDRKPCSRPNSAKRRSRSRTAISANLLRVAFQVAPGADLGDMQKALAKNGVSSEVRSDISPGVAKAITFTDPKARWWTSIRTTVSPSAIRPSKASCRLKFGHIAVPPSRREDGDQLLYRRARLQGFRLDGRPLLVPALRGGSPHRQFRALRRGAAAPHRLRGEGHGGGAARLRSPGPNGIQLVWGPIRHVVGHNVAAYHRSPDDQRIEIFCEMDVMRDEALGYFEPRPWHEDFPQRPKVWPADTLRSYWGFGSFGTFPGYP